jgi:CHAT domain-containing protein
MYETLLAPVLATLDEPPSRLVVVPSSELSGVPFEAFVLAAAPGSADDSGPEYVIDRYEVIYGPSSPVLVELAQMAPRKDPGRVLVMADPLYPGEVVGTADANAKPATDLFAGFARRSAPTPHDLRRLTKTRDEALALGRLLLTFDEEQDAANELLKLEHERSGSLSTKLFDLHLGADALPSRLDSDLRQFSILHFAAHGYVDNEVPQNTGIALAFIDGNSGYFTVADALELDLDAELVVLSACETARGELRPGIGVQSLARAFMYSGTRSVVASLWQVEDTAAAETMTGFYSKFLHDGLPPERALHEAKLALRRGHGTRGVSLGHGSQTGTAPSSHPFFWAPFIYLGLPH